MANHEFGPSAAGQNAEKLCGPACAVVPNSRGYTEPHIHCVARWVTPEGFPIHSMYPDPPTIPPKAYYGFERKGGLRRSGEQPRTNGSQTLLDHPELRLYSKGDTKHMSDSSASHWRQWKRWGEIRYRRHEVDHGNDIELDHLSRPEAERSDSHSGPSTPVTPSSSKNRRSPGSTRPSFVVERQIPVAPSSFSLYAVSVSRDAAYAKRTAKDTTFENGTIRQPLAYSPVLRRTNPDAASSKKGYTDIQPVESPVKRGRSFSARFPRYHAIEPPQVGSPLARGSQSTQRSSRSADRPRSRPVSHKSNGESLRRIASRNAAIRSRAASPVSPVSPVSPISPAFKSETRDRSPGREECYTLRHVQRASLNRIKQRLDAIEESRKRFEAISAYEMIDNDVFSNITRMHQLNAKIEADNLRHGSRNEDDQIWYEFLTELDMTEKAIEVESERLRTVTEIRQAERERKSTSDENGNGQPVKPRDKGKGRAIDPPTPPTFHARPKRRQIPRPSSRSRAGSV